MYTGFFHMQKEPFRMTPDPEFLYLSPSHKEALASIIYGVKQRKGFIAVVGEVGVGKTTILRSFLKTVDKEHVKVIYVFNADVSFKALLRTIYQGLGTPVETDDVNEMLNQLYHILIQHYKNGINVVLIIDEAQNMSRQTLEHLRMLSNLETSTDKLIQIVFSGQPEFELHLDSYELRQLHQRIAVKSTIRPLTMEEGMDYVKHRLAKASVGVGTVFPERVLKQLVKQSQGIPRTINILCDNCLITSFGYKQQKVNLSVLKEISSDLGMVKPTKREAFFVSLMLVVIGVLCFMIYRQNPQRVPGDEIKSVQSVEHLTAQVAKTESSVNSPVLPRKSSEVTEFAEAQSVAKDDEKPLRRKLIRKGDTLANLVKDHYGTVDSRLIEKVKQNNPWIKNANVILEGERIIFPPQE
ncbi:AAA family ATPase [Geomobilimonas luticola]|uniref:AAA family ATPase n=1 Tax=Geomobilimonas luticola TaxID=1114878 RepID=A0ABS5SC07_9BACT|nr:AAA family ATPase [Geomobilimonas luticola]MBT0652915.1 AAA family ATPase [Geomobilimonas luticola]